MTDEVVQGVAEPTIHDPAYWEQDAERLAQFYEDFQNVKVSELEPAQKDRLITFMWKQLFIDHQIIKQLALEAPATSAAKQVRKRTPKIPTTAMPTLEGDPDAA